MTETRFVCEVCETVFSEHGARLNPFDPEEDEVRCPGCGSAMFEPYEFDPDAPLENPLEVLVEPEDVPSS